ncbi:amidase family protein [Streptomyces sp. RK76]|uniref:amidase family protein n=1 Tax=Streptomyces TaxID=1883 RepID=UPI0035A837C7
MGLGRIQAAGGILHARTTTSEFCCMPLSHIRRWGVTRNPWNLAASAGGSFGGSVAALAAGTATLATGSDIAARCAPPLPSMASSATSRSRPRPDASARRARPYFPHGPWHGPSPTAPCSRTGWPARTHGIRRPCARRCASHRISKGCSGLRVAFSTAPGAAPSILRSACAPERPWRVSERAGRSCSWRRWRSAGGSTRSNERCGPISAGATLLAASHWTAAAPA